MRLNNDYLLKLSKLSLCVIVALMGAMSVVSPKQSLAHPGIVQYSEELQLADIPGTEWIQPAPVNECDQPDPAWIFCDDFEQDRSDQYFEGHAFVSNNRTAGVGWNGSTAVKGAFKAGAVGAGGMKVAFGKTPDPYVAPVSHDGEILREIYYRMYLKHDENWIGGGGDKLSRATSLTDNWAQPFIAHVWSGNSTPNNPDRDYLLLDPASGTDEAGNLQSTKYNDFDNLRWLGIKKGMTPIFSPENVGKWYSIEVHVKLNDPGQSNGVFEYWINNTLQASQTNINWLGDYDAYGINTVLFENYWNSGSPQDQNRYFDNIVISTEKIDKDMVVNPESVSGGNAQLGWYAPDGLAEGGELIVFTDGTFDFGNTGPTMLYRQTLSDETAGTPLSTSVPIGRGTVQSSNSGTPQVVAVPELPYGKGIEVGKTVLSGSDTTKQAYVIDTERHEEFYEHVYVYWPADHQDNSLSDLQAATAGWQIKGLWHYLTQSGYSDGTKSDLFAGSPLWYTPGDYFTNGYKVGSNSVPISTFDRTTTGMRDPNNPERWRSSPMLKQFWVKSGPTPGSAAGSDGLYRVTDTNQGMVVSKGYAEAGFWSAANATEVGFDRVSIPGYVRGFDIAKNQHLYFADIYQAVGPGAVARVEITDNANYDASKQITILDVQDWATDEVSATIRKGVFFQESLAGKHLHLHDANNNHLYIGQLSENIPLASAPGVPANVSAIAGNGQAIVSFTAPDNDGGSAITGYEVTASPGNLVMTGSTSPIVFTDLDNGTVYTFTVKAMNAVGRSVSSAVSNTVIPSEFTVGTILTVEEDETEFKQGLLIEAEDFTLEEGGTVTIADRGASHTTGNPLGNTFFNWDKTGHLLEWEFNVPESGSYRIGMRYSSSSLTSVRKLQIDGGEPYIFHYPRTLGGWSDYDNALLQDDDGNDLIFNLEAGIHKIRMVNITSGLNLDYIVLHKTSDSPSQPLTGGTAIITGGNVSLQADRDLELTVGLSELDGSFTALDVIVSYDPDVLAFETVTNGNSVSLANSAFESLQPHYAYASAVNEQQGKIRIIMFSQNEQYAIEEADSLFKLHAQVKEEIAPGVTSVALDKLDVSNFGASIALDTSEANASIQIRLSDNTALDTAIIHAQAIHDQATEGSLPGQFPTGSKAALQTAIDDAATVSEDIHASQAQTDTALQALNASLNTFNLSVIPSVTVDKTALTAALAQAQNRHDRSVEGNRIGHYESGSKELLQDAITIARAVHLDAQASQTEVNQAVAALNDALSAFSGRIVALVPNATAITIADLSIIARYYGVTQGDPNWSEIEKADVLNQGEITIQVLATVARMILNDWLLE